MRLDVPPPYSHFGAHLNRPGPPTKAQKRVVGGPSFVCRVDEGHVVALDLHSSPIGLWEAGEPANEGYARTAFEAVHRLGVPPGPETTLGLSTRPIGE